MFNNVRSILDIESVQICRLCLAEEEGLIHIFNAEGYQGFRLWEIIEELLQIEVSKKDGLPWTVCEGCIKKVEEFKHFKTTCIEAKIYFLTTIANRGLVSSLATNAPAWPLQEPMKVIQKRPIGGTSRMDSDEEEVIAKEETPVVSADEDPLREVTVVSWGKEEGHGGKINLKEEVDADESLSDAESCGEEIHWKDESTCAGVSNDAALSDPLDLIDMKEDADAGESCSEAVTYNQNVLHKNDTLDVGELNVVCLPIEMGELCGDKEEHDPSESLAGEEAQGVEDLAEDEAQLTSVASIISVAPSVGNVVDDCRMAGGISNTSGKMVSDLRGERQEEVTLNDSKMNTNLSCLSGEASLMIHWKPQSVIPKRQVKKKYRENEGGRYKQHNYEMNNLKFEGMMGYELRHFAYHETNITECKEFICDYCDMRYVDRKTLCAHIREHIYRNSSSMNVIPEDLSMRCSEHKVLKSQGHPFKCETCGKEFQWKKSLIAHYVIHSDLKPFKCDVCGKEFNTKGKLQVHSVTHSDLKPFKCDICGKEFKRKDVLRVHYATHSDLKPFKCDTCGKEFKVLRDLRKHSVTHNVSNPFKCETCGKEFKRKDNLQAHSVTHSNMKPFKCERCGKEFKRKFDLRVHSATNCELNPFRCETCGKAFQLKYSLQAHYVIHSGLMPFKCDSCGKEFKRKCSLRAHSVTHSALTPFKCDTCGKRYKRKADLRVHCVTHNN